jgi:hypothetical protein
MTTLAVEHDCAANPKAVQTGLATSRVLRLQPIALD